MFKVTIVRQSDPFREIEVYTTHLPGFQRAYLDLSRASASYGEEFRVLKVDLFQPDEFAKEYNKRKPKGLENTELLWEVGFTLLADDSALQLRNPKLRTYQGDVVLDAWLGEAGPVKIQKKAGVFEMRLADHSPVTAIRRTSSGVEMTYQRTGHDAYPHRRIASRLQEPPGMSMVEKPLPDLGLRIKSVDEAEPRRYSLEADEALIVWIAEVLASANDADEFRKSKGDIAEDMVKRLAPSLGMMVRRDHPFNHDARRTGSERTGPDLLVNLEASGEACYVEIKWWDNAEDAFERAKKQVLRDVRKYPTCEDQKITRGLVAIVDWKLKRDGFSLLVAWATPE